MKNRPGFFPVLIVAALSLALASPWPAPAQTAPPMPAPAGTAPAASPAAAAPAATGSTDTTVTAGAGASAYTVVSGDSLWKIAHQFNTSIRAIKKLNHLKSKLLHPGQVLQIPPASGTESTPPAASPATPSSTQQKSTLHHKVKTATEGGSEVADAGALRPSLATDLSAYLGPLPPATSHHHPKTTGAAAAPVPAATDTATDTELAKAPRAQPVQDFDVPASTFASCPVPLPVETPAELAAENKPAAAAPAPVETPKPVAVVQDTDTTPETSEAPAPRAQLVSPSELAQAAVPGKPAEVQAPSTAPPPAPTAAPSGYVYNESSKHSGNDSFVTDSAPDNSSSDANSATDWASRFRIEAENLADRDIDYDEDWRPPGESHAWAMDCSNTARYLYKVTTGLDLPRTASDQYYYLHLQGKAWDVPENASGYADTNYLRENLKPGDLLFWENTYRPERQPPITHVMVFLGTNDKGQWIMAGSQTSRGGLHNRPNGGPDIYVFSPDKPCGGYSTWLGLVHHKGRFCAFGRPLEADPSKLSVANN